MIEFVFFQGAKVQLFGLYTTGLVITFHFVDNLLVSSEQWSVNREQRAENRGCPIYAWDFLRSVVGAICKSPYAGHETVVGE